MGEGGGGLNRLPPPSEMKKRTPSGPKNFAKQNTFFIGGGGRGIAFLDTFYIFSNLKRYLGKKI